MHTKRRCAEKGLRAHAIQFVCTCMCVCVCVCVCVYCVQATWGTILEDDIASLQAMGFSRARAREALEEHPGSVEEALEWLLSGGAD